MSQLRASVIRILVDAELPGYSIYKLLATKGIDVWPNHVYVLLAKMERGGLLKSRWTGDRGEVPRKHLYSLSQLGNREYNKLVEGSLGVIMDRFFNENLSFEDMSFHVKLAREVGFGKLANWSQENAFRLVIASPSYDPLICFPKFYYILSQAYPHCSIYVVRRTWEKPLEGRRNLTFVDGFRNDMPLRENFADSILLQGFPASSSVEKTLAECLRVLKDDGSLLLEVSETLTREGRIPYNTDFPQYVLKLFYELYGQDRIVRIQDVSNLLSIHFESVKSVNRGGKVIFYAAERLVKATGYAPESLEQNQRAGNAPVIKK